MRKLAIGLGLLVVLVTSDTFAAYIPPDGFTRRPETFAGDAFAIAPDGKVAIGTANFGGGATVKVFAGASAAQIGTSPLRTFSDVTFKAFGDLTFADADTLLFSENVDDDTVYRGIVSSGALTALAPPGSVPNAGGVAVSGANVFVVAANNPGSGALYTISAGSASAALTSIGTGFLSGIAIDGAGNILLTDTNDPLFAGNAGKLLRYTPALSPLSAIDLTDGGGSGAYDVVLDSEGDLFVTTGSTITRIANGTTSAEQFGDAFTGFPFITNLDYVGFGFEPNLGSGQLWVNAVFSDDGAIFGITPIPEPAAVACVAIVAGVVALSRKRRRFAKLVAASLAAFASIYVTTPAHADQFYASQVISRTIGAQQQLAFTDPNLALGPPRGGGTTTNSLDVYCLGNGGSITLGFNDGLNNRGIFNGPGLDFIVYENAFLDADDPHRSFAELMHVEVSSDGTQFARFPVYSATLAMVGPYGTIDPDKVDYFAGVSPVLANVDENTIDPFDPLLAGGDAFDLCWISNHPLVTGGAVDLDHIRYVRLVDVIGDGSTWDTYGRPIFDPTGIGIGGADVDSIAVINGTHMPEPAGGLALACLAMLTVARASRPC